jgi:hypothetical protein
MSFNEIEHFTGYKGFDLSGSNIGTLDMSHNKIKTLPMEFFVKISPSTLQLSSNQISRFADPYANTNIIRTLDLTDNQITVVPFETFAGLDAVQNLILHRNKLVVDLGIFPRNVELLDLRNNDLDEINLDHFIFYRNLKTVLLDGNKFTRNFLNDRIGLSGITEFGVSGNKFFCEQLIQLHETAKRFGKSLTANGYRDTNRTNINGIGCTWAKDEL